MTQHEFLEKVYKRINEPDDYWGNLYAMVKPKPGIGIKDRKHYSQREWNWLSQAKSELW